MDARRRPARPEPPARAPRPLDGRRERERATSAWARTSATAARTSRRRSTRCRAHGVARPRVVLDLRHRPGRRGARPALVPQRLHADRRPPSRPRRCSTPARRSSATSAATSRAACATARGRSTSTSCSSATGATRSERLTLPHEQVTARRFVLVPLLELDFDLRTPDGTRLSDCLAGCPLDEGVRRVGGPLIVQR